MKRTWSIPTVNAETTLEFCEPIGISSQIANVLYQRGISSSREALEFLKPSLLSLASPYAFRDMCKAVQRLDEARKKGEKVLVYGDYDVDGVTSVALLYKVLIDMGFTAAAYIPNRQEEGYGVNREAVSRASAAGVRVIITVDCGITAVAEVELATALGMDVIITDHHEPSGEVPTALAVINPKEDSGYPFRDLAGVGVAFKLVQALYETLGDSVPAKHSELEHLDLVALGTIADVVPLVGENRVLVSYGLRQMECTVHLGLEALLTECGLAGKSLKAGQIAFIVAPRINAAGRMDSARAGLELLLTGHAERATILAKQLTRENILRQDTEKKILAEAIEQISEPIPRVIVLSSPHWHAGVIGIVASRLVERYYRPVFLIEENGEEAKGSARGISGYHVLNNLTAQNDLLTKYGGHKQAAGFSLLTKNIPVLRDRLNAAAVALSDELFVEALFVDIEVNMSAVNRQLHQELELLAPYGFGNPGPLLAARSVPLYEIRQIGKEGEHLKVRLGTQGEWDAVAFQFGRRIQDFVGCDQADAVFSLEINSFQNNERLQLVIRDMENDAVIRTRTTVDAKESCGEEIAAVQAVAEVQVLDWRMLTRNEWLERVSDRNAWIWQVDVQEACVQRLSEFLGSNVKNQTLNNQNVEEQDLHDQNTVGVMIGIPSSWAEFKQGYASLLSLGVKTVILAEFCTEISNSLYQHYEYVTREELIVFYRDLRQHSLRENPFSLTLTVGFSPQRQALKIFEELGIIRILGGVEKVVVEFQTLSQKLDLDTSWRYRSAKIQFDQAVKFREYLREMDFASLMEVVQGDINDSCKDERG